jgi:hypothetical protein
MAGKVLNIKVCNLLKRRRGLIKSTTHSATHAITDVANKIKPAASTFRINI